MRDVQASLAAGMEPVIAKYGYLGSVSAARILGREISHRPAGGTAQLPLTARFCYSEAVVEGIGESAQPG